MIAPFFAKEGQSPEPSGISKDIYLKVDSRLAYLWCAVNAENEALDLQVQTGTNKPAAIKSMGKLLRKYGFVSTLVI